MNSSAPIAARRAERRLAGLALALASVLALAIAGCASKPKRPTPTPPVSSQPTPPSPTRPTPPEPPPVATLPPVARNFALEKARRKQELAVDSRNAVGAAEVGYYLDVLLGRLKQGLGADTGIARRGQHIVIVLPATAAFPVGGTQLQQGLRSKLAPLARVLLEYRRVLVSVHVRADASIVGASNPRLAEQRAQVIAAYLGGAGIDPRRVLLAPAGPARPAQPGARNRIEIVLEPVLQPLLQPKPK